MATLNAALNLNESFTEINQFTSNMYTANEVIYNFGKKTKKSMWDTIQKGEKIYNITKKVATVSFGLMDSYVNTAAGLAMVNDGLQTQEELQQKVLAAAKRSKGSYMEMAAAAVRLGAASDGAFGSNDEAIAFGELLQKSLRVSGLGRQEQGAAFSQITEAIAGGGLQSGDLKSSPMMADAVAGYLSVSGSELMELADQGLVTAEIVKNAMFRSAEDINAKFAEVPTTFLDIWMRIKNVGISAFGDVFSKLNEIVNSDLFTMMLNGLIGMVYLAAGTFGLLLSAVGWLADHMNILIPIILGATGIWMLYHGAAMANWLISKKNVAVDRARLAVTSALTTAHAGLAAVMEASPLTRIITIVMVFITILYAVVALINSIAGTSISATGIIAGSLSVLAAIVGNKVVLMWNLFADLANFICNCFNNVPAAASILFYDLAVTVLGYIETIATSIENLLNAIPGVEVDITGKIGNLKAGLEARAAEIKSEADWKEYVKKKDYTDLGAAYDSGYEFGADLADKTKDLFSGLTSDSFGGGFGKEFGEGFDWDKLGTGMDGFDGGLGSDGNPATVTGTGNAGAVRVENEEDLSMLRTLAERDFVASVANNTLAPNIRVEFSGPITKEADVDGVASHLGALLKEQIAMAPEGVYA